MMAKTAHGMKGRTRGIVSRWTRTGPVQYRPDLEVTVAERDGGRGTMIDKGTLEFPSCRNLSCTMRILDARLRSCTV